MKEKLETELRAHAEDDCPGSFSLDGAAQAGRPAGRRPPSDDPGQNPSGGGAYGAAAPVLRSGCEANEGFLLVVPRFDWVLEVEKRELGAALVRQQLAAFLAGIEGERLLDLLGKRAGKPRDFPSRQGGTAAAAAGRSRKPIPRNLQNRGKLDRPRSSRRRSAATRPFPHRGASTFVGEGGAIFVARGGASRRR